VEQVIFTVTGMSCAHCVAAITDELTKVPGVTAVHIDLETKMVVVDGDQLHEKALRDAIDEAGYEVAS
jgi:copper ion binding protein